MRPFVRVSTRSLTRAVSAAAIALGSTLLRADPRRPVGQQGAAQPAEHVVSSVVRVPDGPPLPEESPTRYTAESIHLLQSSAAPFPSARHPGALVYVPAGIDTAAPLSVVVFIHGWNGCARAVASDVPIPCHEQGPRRGSLGLVSQVRASRRAAVLVIPQMAFEARSSASGQLGDPGGMERFLRDVLTQMAPNLGTHGIADIQHLVLASHSGGYITVARLLSLHELRYDEVAMFDSLYLPLPPFQGFLLANAARLAPGAEHPLRFVSLYREGATMASTRDVERLVTPSLRTQSPGMTVVSRRAPIARVTEAEASASLVFARVPGDHQQAVRWNLATVLAASGIGEVQE